MEYIFIVTLQPIEGGDVSFLVSRNPGLFPRKREAMQYGLSFFWIPAFAGMTPFTRPTPGLADLSTARGERDCFIRLKCYFSSKTITFLTQELFSAWKRGAIT